MPDAATFGLFVAAALAILLVPGPAVFYIVACGVEGGRVAGLVSCLGVEVGILAHAAFAAVGLSAVPASSATAFAVVKWLGAAYLIWLGLKRLLGRDEEDAPAAVEPEPLSRLFSQGVIVQVLNPKVALFLLAFLPQFVDSSRGDAWMQILVLGATLAVLGLLTDGLYALLGGTASAALRRRGGRFRRVQRYFSGGIYLALGAASAASGSGKD
ncbi:MAG TPA: LysE family translocator [Rubrobacteraceae bacterium]